MSVIKARQDPYFNIIKKKYFQNSSDLKKLKIKGKKVIILYLDGLTLLGRMKGCRCNKSYKLIFTLYLFAKNKKSVFNSLSIGIPVFNLFLEVIFFFFAWI